MKNIVLMCAALFVTGMLFAQTKPVADSVLNAPKVKKGKAKKVDDDDKEDKYVPKVQQVKKDWSKIDLSKRPTDHLMIQYGYEGWASKPDVAQIGSGFSRYFNAYVMFDKPFKNDPRFSAAYGIGIGNDNIFFKETLLDIASKQSTSGSLTFQPATSTNHYKKYKLSTTYLEVPLEMRFMSNPENSAKSWKFALGAKAGLLIDAHTKGKTGVDQNGNILPGQDGLIEKESSTKLFNSTKVAATVRIGYGFFSLYGAYQITSLISSGVGANVRPYSIGISISGL